MSQAVAGRRRTLRWGDWLYADLEMEDLQWLLPQGPIAIERVHEQMIDASASMRSYNGES